MKKLFVMFFACMGIALATDGISGTDFIKGLSVLAGVVGLGIAALGGGIGTIAGMYTFHHKTQKIQFVIGFPLITILEVITIIWFLVK